jgi:AAA family ATP:ADP antiporter
MTIDSKHAADKKEEEKDPNDTSDFNLFQKWIAPIRLNEVPKVLPVVLLMALSLFIYTANRDVKDAVVFGEEGQSIMTVQYCKVIVMIIAIPVATAFLKLDNMVSRDFIFFQTVLSFATYFLVNGLCLLPYRDSVHQFGSSVIRDEQFSLHADNFRRLAPLMGSVIFPISTINYVFSELWGTISVSFLVWGYVNMVTPKKAAKRYYAVLGIGGQFGSMAGAWFVQMRAKSGATFAENMRYMNIWMSCLSLVFAAVYAFLQYYIMKKPQYAVPTEGGGKKKGGGKPKMTVMQALKYCMSEPYVLALCGMVFAYGFVMVLGEMTYKDLMKLSFDGDRNAYSGFKGLESQVCGFVAIFLMIFVGHNVIRLFGWTVTALLCPTIAGLCVAVMYVMALCGDYYGVDSSGTKYFAKPEAHTYLVILRTIGLIFAVASKAVKYASFDPAKELAYLALTSEQKYKAKAAVDIVGARFGKGGGALFNILVISLALGKDVSYVRSTLIASLIGVGFGMVIWVMSDLYIGTHMAAISKRTEDALAAKEPAMESVKVEGGATKTGFHIEMSTQPDASFTVGSKQTPLPSRQNTPETGEEGENTEGGI